MSKLEVLVYIDWFSPGFKAGGPIRSLVNLVNSLEDDISFHILTSDTDYMSSEPYAGLNADTWLPYGKGHEVRYVSRGQRNLAGLRKAIAGRTFDKVYVNGLFSKVFSIYPLVLHRKEKVKIIVAPRGMLKDSARQFKAVKKSLYLKLARWQGLFQGLEFHATDEQELKDIRSFFRANVIRYAPNLPGILPAYTPLEKSSGTLKLCFIGRIAPEKNLKFALNVLSKIEEGNLGFEIYGAVYDEKYWSGCKHLIDQLPKNIEVSHHESFLPHEVTEIFQRNHILFLPTCGENFGHVILESFMAGRPVLISDQTPWLNLEKKGVGLTFSLGDEASFVKGLEGFIEMGDTEYQELSRKAYSLAREFNADSSLKAKAKAVFLP